MSTAWERDPFFQYPLNRVTTSQGELALPILYHDCSTVMALFLVDEERARAAVVDPGLSVVRVWGNKVLVAVAFYEYRQTAIGPYNEVGVAVLVTPRDVPAPQWPLRAMLGALDKNTSGFHVIDLPVTTEAARAAGREVWGYPKFVTPIQFDRQGRQFSGAVIDPTAPGQALVALNGKAGIGIPGPLLDLSLYSRLDGPLLRTLVVTRGGASICMPGSLRLNVSAQSQHVMAQRLRALGLHDQTPLIVTMSDALQLRLNAGAPVPEGHRHSAHSAPPAQR